MYSNLIKYLKTNCIPILLIILSIYDLRVDLRLLFDFFTLSSLFSMLYHHPLAIAVLLTNPYFLRPH